jgi:hypothetical protein
MDTKELIKVINEEIDRFDFLSRDIKEESDAKKSVVDSKDFKVNFVNDVLTNNTDTIKFSEVVGSKKDNNNPNDIFNVGKSDVYYEIHIYYEFFDKEYELTLLLEGNNIKSEPKIDYTDIDVILTFDENGEEIDLDWLKNDEEMYGDFIKTLIKNDFDEE